MSGNHIIFSVLIETSWNVKTNKLIIIPQVLAVLIETSWNVKQVETAKTYFVELSINRNIVECKGPPPLSG